MLSHQQMVNPFLETRARTDKQKSILTSRNTHYSIDKINKMDSLPCKRQEQLVQSSSQIIIIIFIFIIIIIASNVILTYPALL
jgi:lipopolysaccharide/colanic/teichoic acid biosynthesis glycosyltransferase